MQNYCGSTEKSGETAATGTEAVKERLREYRRAGNRCAAITRKIQNQRANMLGNRNMSADALDVVVDKIAESEKQLAAEQKTQAAALADAEYLISLADQSEGRQILRLRYLHGVRFEDIPERLFTSARSMWRKYNRAVNTIAGKIEETEKK